MKNTNTNATTACGPTTVKSTDLLDHNLFETWIHNEDQTLKGLKIEGKGQITILDRMTGWGEGIRDIETGYRDENNKFWLVSGSFDITKQGCGTVDNAIVLIKANANTCIGA